MKFAIEYECDACDRDAHHIELRSASNALDYLIMAKQSYCSSAERQEVLSSVSTDCPHPAIVAKHMMSDNLDTAAHAARTAEDITESGAHLVRIGMLLYNRCFTHP